MDIYEFFDTCREQGMDGQEAMREWTDCQEERKRSFLENYYNDPVVQDGWRQQDLIDMYRRGR